MTFVYPQWAPQNQSFLYTISPHTEINDHRASNKNAEVLPSDSGEATNPFSEGHVERHMFEDALRSRFSIPVHNIDNRDSPPQQGTQAAQGSISSHQTRTLISRHPETQRQHLENRFRLLIQPLDLATFHSFPNHQHQEEHISCQAILPIDNSLTQSIALTQGWEDTSYAIMRPLHCELCYDPSADSITFMNRERKLAIIISPTIDGIVRGEGIPFIVTGDDGDRALLGQTVFTQPFRRYRFDPGAWTVSRNLNYDSDSDSPAFRFEVYRRNYSLQVLGTKNDLPLLAEVAGLKRKHDGGKTTNITKNESSQNDTSSTSAVIPLNNDSHLIRRIDDLGELKGGKLVLMTGHTKDGIEEYQIRRLGHARSARNSTVFQAKVTTYPSEHILAKLVKGRDAADTVKN
ncbi:hypothetical protein F4802DRAFT_104462 [Xylaria palmicola]|nr:hypothetical protein F4802DRAFT_104462 [Xylaria palmicola]